MLRPENLRLRRRPGRYSRGVPLPAATTTAPLPNNVTKVTGGSVKIETNTNQAYLGNGSSKPGNDVQLSINGGALVVGTEDDSVDFHEGRCRDGSRCDLKERPGAKT